MTRLASLALCSLHLLTDQSPATADDRFLRWPAEAWDLGDEKAVLLTHPNPSASDKRFLPLPAEAWDLGDEAAVRRRLRLELDDVARKRALQGYEIPRDFILERDAFSKANYLLTDSGKPAVGRLREKCAPLECIPPRDSKPAPSKLTLVCRAGKRLWWLVCPGARCVAAEAQSCVWGDVARMSAL